MLNCANVLRQWVTVSMAFFKNEGVLYSCIMRSWYKSAVLAARHACARSKVPHSQFAQGRERLISSSGQPGSYFWPPFEKFLATGPAAPLGSLLLLLRGGLLAA
jgi:hypothetical protein